MPRKRKATQETQTAEVVAPQQEPQVEVEQPIAIQTHFNKPPQERKPIMALSPDQIRAIYAKRRTKGQYTEFLTEFLASNENGVSVKEQWNTQLGDKQATTLKQGFENAKDKKEAPEGADQVDVIVDGEDVFLINRSAVDLEAELATA